MITLVSLAFAGDLTLHEWGTFTSVYVDGEPIEWRSLEGPSDLPSFVYSTSHPGYRDFGPRGKGDTMSRVRMETPVVYFYADEPTKVTLSVTYRDGVITEWYPKARSVSGHTIDWGAFLVDPTIRDRDFPASPPDSAYTPARATDATPVRVCDQDGAEVEKFLFYRGIGDDPPPVSVGWSGNDVLVRGDRAGRAILFERRGEKTGFTLVDAATDRVARPKLDGDVPRTIAALEAELRSHGLFPAEAHAMTETWKKDWFEDGVRLLYVMDRGDVDRALPMQVDPKPASSVRVIVGRAELIAPEVAAAASARLGADRRSDPEVLTAFQQEYGRFYEGVLAAARDLLPDPAKVDRLLTLAKGSAAHLD